MVSFDENALLLYSSRTVRFVKWERGHSIQATHNIMQHYKQDLSVLVIFIAFYRNLQTDGHIQTDTLVVESRLSPTSKPFIPSSVTASSNFKSSAPQNDELSKDDVESLTVSLL